ncbi:carboxypeptidase-like regulatory domain-containing protein [Ferrimonas futtsuensis]|uniref:carboxypeptidase-like regulatory domain-containing protein n=1 Tax=Ferrimonas futtsuensis TaxID=364764 RepID=UPI0004122480|nr:carboxypeptidase-like regulatory domain-containing protein [Ferrimonas futtsuensis]
MRLVLLLVLLTALPHKAAHADAAEATPLVLQLIYRGELLSEDLLAYESEGRLYLPLQQLADLLLMPLLVDVEHGRAEGSLSIPADRFRLENRQLLRSGYPKVSLTGLINDGWDLFLPADQLAPLWRLTLTFSARNQTLRLSADELLPLDKVWQRQQRLALLQQQQARSGAGQPVYTSRYALMGDPALHNQLSLIRSNGDTQGSLLLDGVSDLAHHQAQFNLQLDDQTRRLRASVQRHWDLPWLSQYRLGSITGPNAPLVSRGELGWGADLRQGESLQSDQFITTVLEGPAPPDWDAELYREGDLIDAQRIGSDGRYRFDNVALYLGQNRFRILLYGPNGEERQVSLSHPLNGSQLAPGSSGTRLTALTWERGGGSEAQLEWGYGLSDALSLQLGHHYLQAPDLVTDHYSSLALVGRLGGVLTQVRGIKQWQGGQALALALQGDAGGWQWQLSGAHYHDYLSAAHRQRQLRHQWLLRASGRLWDLGWRFEAGTDTLSDDDQHLASLTLNGQWRQSSWSHALTWRGSGEHSLKQQLALSGRVEQGRVRGYADLQWQPSARLQRLGVNLNYPLDRHLGGQSELVLLPRQPQQWQFNQNLNLSLDSLLVSLGVSVSGDQDYQARLELSHGLLWDRQEDTLHWYADDPTREGDLALSVFWDRNGNGHREPGEPPLDGVRFRCTGRSDGGRTDRRGQLLLAGLPADSDLVLQLDESSLADPFMLSPFTQRHLRLHAGHIERLNVPMVMGSEVEGEVMLSLPDQDDRPAAGLAVSLENTDGITVAQTRVDYDGLFLLQGIRPGQYRLKIQQRLYPIDLSPDGEILNLGRLYLPQKSQIQPE